MDVFLTDGECHLLKAQPCDLREPEQCVCVCVLGAEAWGKRGWGWGGHNPPAG